jgi:hypothetical protein
MYRSDGIRYAASFLIPALVVLILTYMSVMVMGATMVGLSLPKLTSAPTHAAGAHKYTSIRLLSCPSLSKHYPLQRSLTF